MLCVGHIVGTLQRIGVLNGRIGIIIGKKQGFIFVSGQRRIPSLVQICIHACRSLGIAVTLWHFNRETGKYYSQEVEA